MTSLVVYLDFDSKFFFQILFSTAFVWPAILVIEITLVAQTAGIIFGFFLALGRMSRNPVFKLPVDLYLWIFRGTPLVLQILFIYDGTAELFNNPPLLYPITRNAVIAGTLALALNEAAYMTEIIRAGLQAVDPGQVDAAKALGMNRWQVMTRIVIPQAMRIIVPPTFNEYINMSKNTSLLVIMGGVAELLFTAQAFYSANFRVFEALAVAAIWYLLITTFLTQIQSAIEKRFGERQDIPMERTNFMRRLMLGGGRR
ncbi:MAG: amino acid ABC transporter permease [Candidatus Dormiibacterota bacterium]